ncbi:hypothetical protein [Mameliella sediminis]|uniref:hypothetical protein n=1 Tax=Mameliella sediminis TaxID=2836866 RepID=UPI001C48B910|nr:hypothetical protein [Mameliella sediminis]MBY6113411.1 hypothetical protein [Antarctobacter heliothermus]MBY6143241.1 hypothetical protein [Mameliella alba]MBV7394709.1 hypothetical protein [Mameliella sediminis]MBY6163158.1 hypothetical protein [Mameliella alba]MBY6171422.1 hypothetical protein [Mameliella alba]
MSDQKDARPTLPGLYARGSAEGVTGIEIAAAAVSVVWVLLSGWYFLGLPAEEGGPLRFLLALMVIVMPVALIWVAALAIRAARVMRAESQRLQAAIDAIRQSYVSQAQSGRNQPPHPTVIKRLDDLASAQKNVEATLAMLAGIRQGGHPSALPAPETAEGEHQPALSLGTPAEALQPPLSNADYIRALHFPETAEDEEGFAALRRALKDRGTAKLIQAAQDVLTLLSQDSIYMDDLRPDLARPEVWRAFAQGERGRAIASLGGIRDRSSLALAAGRMKQDPIFRDAAHHFLRRFDTSFSAFEPNASDEEISGFAMTRTARAFMLLGRVAGTFD